MKTKKRNSFMKRKSSLILNIMSLCLLVATIVIGVVAAKKVTVDMSGTVSFTASNTEITFNAKIEGAKIGGTSGTYYIQNSGNPTTNNTSFPIKGETTLSFGNLAFDHNADNTAKDIIFTFTITSSSDYDITATLSQSSLVLAYGITARVSNNGCVISPGEANKGVVKLILSVNSGVTADISNAVSGNLSFTFDRYTDLNLQYNETIGWHLNMGKVTSTLATATGVANNTPLAWVPVIELSTDGTMTAFNGKLQSNKPQKGHTYYFISYNILPVLYGTSNEKQDGIPFNFYDMSTNGLPSWYFNGTNLVKHSNTGNSSNIVGTDYSVSNIRSYLKGNTSYAWYSSEADIAPDTTMPLANFLSLYGLLDDQVYTSRIIARTLADLYTNIIKNDIDYSSAIVPTTNAPNANNAATEDKLWLLSCMEYETCYSNDNQGTAKTIGGTYGDWWLRSPRDPYDNEGHSVNYFNIEVLDVDDVASTRHGVRPSFQIVV